MKPKAEIFFDAITLLREDIVEEAQDYRFRRKPSAWKKVGSLAACLALIASLSLLMLPRGCGGADMNSSGAPMQSTDSCAPADAPASGDSMPEPAEPPASPEGGYGQLEAVQFTAVVIAIDSDSILLGNLEGADEDYQVAVYTSGLELPELAEGDTVRITHMNGPLLTTDPPVLSTVVSIEKLENDS